MTSSDLLLELGCEDLPARYVGLLAEALETSLANGLDARQVTHGAVRRYATPRRLAVLIEGVAAAQPEQAVELSGPPLAAALKDGQPTPAALGFAKKCGVDFPALGQKDGRLHYARREPGKATAALVPELFEDALKAMDLLVPKRMRWGGGEETFVRPVSWLVCLLGDAVVPLRRFGLAAGRTTYGHRFHAPEAIALAAPADYEPALRAAKVWADFDSRREEIRRQIAAKADALGGRARVTEELLTEVAALVEWPVVIAGRMEERFLTLPPEVIVATVETNQRYFTVFADADMSVLTPHFITVANLESKDVAQVIEGNERVVRPRLADALFFYEQDRRQPLASYGEKLATATYQKELGSQAERVQRLVTIAGAIARAAEADVAVATAAARLCKNDLATRMVGEFPELQGLVGGYYVAAEAADRVAGLGVMGEFAPDAVPAAIADPNPEAAPDAAAVARAVREHYLPTQAGTAIPATREGQVLALADKLDALAGIFAIGQKPTASKDPFALRRAANGVLSILINGKFGELDLRWLFDRALSCQPAGARGADTLEALIEFVMERLRARVLASEMTVEMFEAVKAHGVTAPREFWLRLRAVSIFSNLPQAADLSAAHKRVRNILKQAGTSAGTGTAQPALFQHEAERALFDAMQAVEKEGLGDTELRATGSAEVYTIQLNRLAALREPVDTFFTAVMVNADDPEVRANRLALLAQLDAMCRTVADISLLPGG